MGKFYIKKYTFSSDKIPDLIMLDLFLKKFKNKNYIGF